MKRYISLILSLFGLSCSTTHIALESEETFDLKRYMGKWYEIARLPNKFEEGLEENTAFYELREDGDVTVINQGRVIANKSRYKEVKGRAWVPDPNEPSKLKVSFFWPFSGDYWVLRVDKDYTIALVGDPSREYLWILARDRRPDPKAVSELKIYASSLGYAVENMISGLAD